MSAYSLITSIYLNICIVHWQSILFKDLQFNLTGFPLLKKWLLQLHSPFWEQLTHKRLFNFLFLMTIIMMSHLGVQLLANVQSQVMPFTCARATSCTFPPEYMPIFIEKQYILNISLCIHILILYKRVTVSLQPALFELNLFSHLLLRYCNISTHMCIIVHNVHVVCMWVFVCMPLWQQWLTGHPAGHPNVEKGNRQWERQWGGLEGKPSQW